MNQNPLYLVPYDFTTVSESALELAHDLAVANNGTVTLLHVAKTDSEKIEAKLKFKKVMDGLSDIEQKRVMTRVIVGDIYVDINKAGEILDASLIVMGTHGAKGFQKVFGSHAVKMISAATNPYLITQGKKSVDKIETIVMPFSYDKKSMIITGFAAKIAKKFNAHIHLVGSHDSDQDLENSRRTNEIVVRKYLDERKVKYTFADLEKSGGFENSLIKYAADHKADLIAAGYYKEGLLTNPNSFIQAMIENELHLPLLTVNAEGLTIGDGHSAATGY